MLPAALELPVGGSTPNSTWGGVRLALTKAKRRTATSKRTKPGHTTALTKNETLNLMWSDMTPEFIMPVASVHTRSDTHKLCNKEINNRLAK